MPLSASYALVRLERQIIGLRVFSVGNLTYVARDVTANRSEVAPLVFRDRTIATNRERSVVQPSLYRVDPSQVASM
ncbi:MAG: hypothetical protein ACE5FA_09190 [Dehalococcoidia bacterium]